MAFYFVRHFLPNVLYLVASNCFSKRISIYGFTYVQDMLSFSISLFRVVTRFHVLFMYHLSQFPICFILCIIRQFTGFSLISD